MPRTQREGSLHHFILLQVRKLHLQADSIINVCLIPAGKWRKKKDALANLQLDLHCRESWSIVIRGDLVWACFSANLSRSTKLTGHQNFLKQVLLAFLTRVKWFLVATGLSCHVKCWYFSQMVELNWDLERGIKVLKTSLSNNQNEWGNQTHTHKSGLWTDLCEGPWTFRWRPLDENCVQIDVVDDFCHQCAEMFWNRSRVRFSLFLQDLAGRTWWNICCSVERTFMLVMMEVLFLCTTPVRLVMPRLCSFFWSTERMPTHATIGTILHCMKPQSRGKLMFALVSLVKNTEKLTLIHKDLSGSKSHIWIFCLSVLLQHGADPNIRNTDGKTALDLADLSAKPVLTGDFRTPFCTLSSATSTFTYCTVCTSGCFSRHLLWQSSSGEYKKDELLESARSGNEEKMMSSLTPLNVNCHASDGRKVLHLQL